eukprot:12909974-Prorocentrum_lima.AAC.1
MMMHTDGTYMDTCISLVSNLTKWCLDREAKAAKQSWLSLLESSLLGGASKLHRATKGPQQEGHVEEDGSAW